MTSPRDLFPPWGLRLDFGPLTLRGLTDEDLIQLAELAERGIHEGDRMPFLVPWTDAPPAALARNTAKYHWLSRAAFAPEAWSLHLGVWADGALVGTQSIETRAYLVTRTGETGSWLGRASQGQGIGTLMRRAICALMFDHLDAEEVTSGAFLDNPESLAVSRKVGYLPNGVRRLERRPGELAVNQRLVLTPETFIRGEHRLVVSGVEHFRRAIGLDPE